MVLRRGQQTDSSERNPEMETNNRTADSLPGSALITRAVKIIDMIWISKLLGTAWGMDQVGHDFA